MAKKTKFFDLDQPLLHPGHRRPRTRREFIAQSFALGGGAVVANSLLGLFPNSAYADLSLDVANQLSVCNAGNSSTGMLPFICFDLAGGANIAGSNVLVGYKGGQLDPLSQQGYSMLGLPGTMLPNSSTNTFIDTSLGLAFHSDSAFLRGIKSTCSVTAMGLTEGAVIPARSENDTGNNPHNPMYAIYKAGARGALVDLIGSENSDSGGNSMAPAMLIDLKARPTQVTRPSDVTALVGTSSDIPSLLSQSDTVAAMESVARISTDGVDHIDAIGKAGPYYQGSFDYSAKRVDAGCEIIKSADNTDRFGATSPDPIKDNAITGGGPSNFTSIFPLTNGQITDSEHLKTASIMKLVLGQAGNKHYAAAGTISMGGFDYHTGDRATGEGRDFRAGQCMGACIEYAHRVGSRLMLYVFSDGSLSSNGGMDNTVGGRGKNNWDSDNQSTGAAFFLVYNPTKKPNLVAGRQLGWMRTDGSVETAGSPGANSVTQLVDMVVLNYLALQGQQNLMSNAFGGPIVRPESSILGGTTNWNKYIAFEALS